MTKKNQNTEIPSSPFVVQSIVGFNTKVPILNLTNSEEKPKVAYASGHIVTIFDCETKTTEYVLGHERDIFSIKTDETCKLLVTADKYLINIWERQVEKKQNQQTVLLKTFNDPFNGEPILATAVSVDGEYLVIASQRFMQLWIWRNGSEIPNAVHELPENFRTGSRITFCKSNIHSNCFILPTEKNLLFCRWNIKKKLLQMHSPKQFPGVRQIVDSTYCTNYSKGVSLANESVIVWSDTPPSKETKFDLFENRMEFQFKMTLGFYQLKTVSCCEGFIIISDAKGDLRFYDENMKFCFLYDLFGQTVQSISFIYRAMEMKNENGAMDLQLKKTESSHVGLFFVCCENGKTFKCKLNTKPTLIFESDRIFMTCFDVHPKMDFLCGGRKDGNIFLYDYTKKTFGKILLLSSSLPKNLSKSKSENLAAICLKFSSCGRYVAAGLNNGHLAIVKTLPFQQFQKAIQLAETDAFIESVIFSNSNEFIVYHDSNCTVGLLYFESSSWKLLKKCRVHDSTIMHMSFRETVDEIGLITISEDYLIAKYTIKTSDNVVDILMDSCKRVDFLSVLKCCIPLQQNIMAFPTDNSGNAQAFLTTDEKFKFQVRHFDSFEMIHTFAAPITENKPISIMCPVNVKNENAIAFSNKNIIGLHHLPIDGNPKKYLAMVGHPRKILKMKVSHCNKYLFTIGRDDPSVYIWKIQMPAVIKQYTSGGASLKPFCNLIPDGVSGQLFQEMQDLFIYMQIKRQKEHSNDSQEYKLIDGIPALDAIDFMRSIGFFPSEAKVEYIMEDIKHYTNDSSMITFENLMKLFVNYKPPFGYLQTEIHQTLKYLGYSYTMQSADTELTRDRLVEIFTTLGEEMDMNEAAVYLNRLDGQCETVDESEPETLINNIRSVYTIAEFFKYILGVESY